MKNINAEVKIRANFFKFDIAEWIREDGPEMQVVKELAHKYVYRKDLAKDRIFKALCQVGIITGVQAGHNIVPTAARTILARVLKGDAVTADVDYGALGTGVSPSFTNSSTQLSSEQYRKQASDRSNDNNVVFIDWFIASGDVADGTYTEFGAFIGGTASADSGTPFSLYATGDWVKSGAMYISAKYTIT
jgi:hypothetical protein